MIYLHCTWLSPPRMHLEAVAVWSFSQWCPQLATTVPICHKSRGVTGMLRGAGACYRHMLARDSNPARLVPPLRPLQSSQLPPTTLNEPEGQANSSRWLFAYGRETQQAIERLSWQVHNKLRQMSVLGEPSNVHAAREDTQTRVTADLWAELKPCSLNPRNPTMKMGFLQGTEARHKAMSLA